MTAARFVHFLGLVLWIGPVLGAVAVVLYAARGDAGTVRPAARAAHSAIRSLGNTGMALAWLGGLGMLVPAFASLYARAGWMHAKLTLVLVASALTGLLSAKLRKLADGHEGVSEKSLVPLNAALALTAFVILVLVGFRPF